MSTDLKATPLEHEASAAQSTALAPAPTEAERRVALAKERLQSHLAALEVRAVGVAKQSAWIAGMVLLGLVGAAAAASLFRPKSRRAPDYAESGSRLGPALMLAAAGLLARGARSFARRAR